MLQEIQEEYRLAVVDLLEADDKYCIVKLATWSVCTLTQGDFLPFEKPEKFACDKCGFCHEPARLRRQLKDTYERWGIKAEIAAEMEVGNDKPESRTL